MMTDSIIDNSGNQIDEAYMESPLKNSGSKLIATLRNLDEESKQDSYNQHSILEDSIYQD